jgi:putative FmdB family regulatory protein
MPIYDCVCSMCGNIIEQFLRIEETPISCVKCGSIMNKMPGGYFRLSYNNQTDSCTWSDGGYSSSQFWNGVKEARSQGKKVKGSHEQ